MKLLLGMPGGSEWVIIIIFFVILGLIVLTLRKRNNSKRMVIPEIKIENNHQTSFSQSNITDDKFNQLEKIGRLKDIGILSKEEFETEKKKILDR